MRPSHNSAQLKYLLCWPFQYRRSFQCSWYPCIYWYLYMQKMTDESDATPFYKKQPEKRPYIFTGYFMDGGATECKLLSNSEKLLTRNRKFILCGRTSNIILSSHTSTTRHKMSQSLASQIAI